MAGAGPLPNRNEANKCDRHRDKSKIEPHSVPVGSLWHLEKLDRQPHTNSKSQGHANQITPGGVCTKNGLFLGHGDAHRHNAQHAQKYPAEQRTRYAEAGRYLGPGNVA